MLNGKCLAHKKDKMNFATFFAQAIKDKTHKRKRGKYKGQYKSLRKDLPMPGPGYISQPGKTQAPSASTYAVRG